jgi:hypothetical protein
MAVNPNAPYEVLAQLKAEGKTSATILHNVNSFIEAMWNKTTPNLAAQEKRAEATHHIHASLAAWPSKSRVWLSAANASTGRL